MENLNFVSSLQKIADSNLKTILLFLGLLIIVISLIFNLECPSYLLWRGIWIFLAGVILKVLYEITFVFEYHIREMHIRKQRKPENFRMDLGSSFLKEDFKIAIIYYIFYTLVLLSFGYLALFNPKIF